MRENRRKNRNEARPEGRALKRSETNLTSLKRQIRKEKQGAFWRITAQKQIGPVGKKEWRCGCTAPKKGSIQPTLGVRHPALTQQNFLTRPLTRHTGRRKGAVDHGNIP